MFTTKNSKKNKHVDPSVRDRVPSKNIQRAVSLGGLREGEKGAFISEENLIACYEDGKVFVEGRCPISYIQSPDTPISIERIPFSFRIVILPTTCIQRSEVRSKYLPEIGYQEVEEIIVLNERGEPNVQD